PRARCCDGRQEREPLRGARRRQRLLRRRPAHRLPQARHGTVLIPLLCSVFFFFCRFNRLPVAVCLRAEMAPGQVRRRRELSRRRCRGGQGEVPEDPGSLRR
ncbi:hypothetical protein EE612_044650, partial [Oryza sativa]